MNQYRQNPSRVRGLARASGVERNEPDVCEGGRRGVEREEHAAELRRAGKTQHGRARVRAKSTGGSQRGNPERSCFCLDQTTLPLLDRTKMLSCRLRSTKRIAVAVSEVLNTFAKLLIVDKSGSAFRLNGLKSAVGIKNSDAKILASTSIGLPL